MAPGEPTPRRETTAPLTPATTPNPARVRRERPELRAEDAPTPRATRKADALALVVLAAIALALAVINRELVLAALSSRYTAVAVVASVATLLVVKSGDRTRIYRIEAQQLRRQRRQLVRLLGEARTLLRIGVEGPSTEEEGRPGDWRQRARNLMEEIDRNL